MDSLRPDLDELNQYKSRQTGGKRSAKRGKVESEPSVQRAVAKPQAGTSFVSKLFIFVLLLACGALSYFAWMQHQNIQALDNKISESDDFISQSKLLMARLEGELSETGAELEQSGSAAQKKLAFLDSEMRKLWGVSNDRNKKSIKSNREDIDKLKGDLSKKMASQSKSVTAMGDKLKAVTTQQSALDSQLATMASEWAIVRSEQEEVSSKQSRDIAALAQSEKSLMDKLAKLEAELLRATKTNKELEASVSAIDASRRQLVQRIIGLESRLEKSLKPANTQNLVPTTP